MAHSVYDVTGCAMYCTCAKGVGVFFYTTIYWNSQDIARLVFPKNLRRSYQPQCPSSNVRFMVPGLCRRSLPPRTALFQLFMSARFGHHGFVYVVRTFIPLSRCRTRSAVFVKFATASSVGNRETPFFFVSRKSRFRRDRYERGKKPPTPQRTHPVQNCFLFYI